MSKMFKYFKRGTTFETTVLYVPRTGELENLIGCTAFSKIKDAAGKRHELTCTISGDGFSILVTGAPTLTKDIALGQAFWDLGIETDTDDIIPTATWQFEVVDFISDQTR